MILTPDNYHSSEARAEWISSTDVKTALRCEALWAARDAGARPYPEQSESFAYGHLFEAALTGTAEEYISAHPELLLTRGSNKGQLRAAYADALDLAQDVRRSPFLAGLVDRCRKQVILTGELEGLPVRVMMDLVDEDGSIYDIKTAHDFRQVWDNGRGAYTEWWELYHYPVQLWIYREIAQQNGFTVPHVGLIGASKRDGDVQALRLSKEVLDGAGADARYALNRMAAIRAGSAPEACGSCDYCIGTKIITGFEEV